ncbi:MAG: thiamine pyrophosphate-dependent dehydrogenase E1 component subunit alpha, partial [Desulfobacterales bacterium]|nr:thiamine pyrophosphate-dependent dehydrogenase E1 component subunit alpha [Desulfobacterales bacterium]
AAGVCQARDRDDQVSGTHRSHAHYIAKGGDIKAMMAEIYGKATGCSSGKGGSMHLVDLSVSFQGSTSIVANTVPLGVGAALANQLYRNGKGCCVFFGDAVIEEGVFHESVNFAVVRHLPVLFVCENNLYSVYSPLSVRQPEGREIWKFVAGYGMPSVHGDGNDVWDVYHKAKTALEHICSGAGPCFLEFATYRWREHCGPNFDNDLGYRTEAEYLHWKQRDPIALFESQLTAQGVIKPTDIDAMGKTIQMEVDEAFDFAENSPFPDPEETFKGVYRE